MVVYNHVKSLGLDIHTLFLFIPRLQSPLPVITSAENSHADTPDNSWAINNAWCSVG